MATKEIEHNLPQGLFTLTPNFDPPLKFKKISEKNLTGTPPLTRFFGPGKTVLKQNCIIGGVF